MHRHHTSYWKNYSMLRPHFGVGRDVCMPLLFFFFWMLQLIRHRCKKNYPLCRCLLRIDVTCALNHHRMQHGNKPEKNGATVQLTEEFLTCHKLACISCHIINISAKLNVLTEMIWEESNSKIRENKL